MSEEFRAMEKELLGVQGLERLLSETGSGETQRGKTDMEAPSGRENEFECWIQRVTDEGQTYYYNTMTGDAQWDKPEGFQGERKTSGQTESKNEKSSSCPWMEMLSPDGFTYYYNTETGESRWEKPAQFSPLVEASSVGVGEEQGEEEEDTSSPTPEPLSGEEESLRERAADAEEVEDSRVLQRRKREVSKDDDGADKEDDDDNDDENDDDNEDDKSTSPEDVEDETPAKKARKTSPSVAGEQAEEQDPNGPGDLEEHKVKIEERRTAPTVGKGATREGSRKRKLENGKSGKGKDDVETQIQTEDL